MTDEKEKRPRGRPKIQLDPKTEAKVKKIWFDTKTGRADRLNQIRSIIGIGVSEPWIYRHLGVPTANERT